MLEAKVQLASFFSVAEFRHMLLECELGVVLHVVARRRHFLPSLLHGEDATYARNVVPFTAILDRCSSLQLSVRFGVLLPTFVELRVNLRNNKNIIFVIKIKFCYFYKIN